MEKRFALKLTVAFLITMLYGAGPVNEGTELSLAAGGGQYQSIGCGAAARKRHADALVGARHRFAGSGITLTGEAGVADETTTGITDHGPGNQTVHDFDRRHYQSAAILGRIGYQWRWASIEAGPYYSGMIPEIPLPSLVARLQPTQEIYLYASTFDTATQRDFIGAGLGWQGEKFRFDGSLRAGAGFGLRLRSDVRISDRWRLGAMGYAMTPGSVYAQGSGYGLISYDFGAREKVQELQ